MGVLRVRINIGSSASCKFQEGVPKRHTLLVKEKIADKLVYSEHKIQVQLCRYITDKWSMRLSINLTAL